MANTVTGLTTRGHKSITVYSPLLVQLGRIDAWISLVWQESYNTYSSATGAQLELVAGDETLAMCRPDNYIWLTGSERIMRIKSVQQEDKHIIVNAEDAVCVLADRVHYDTLSGGFELEPTMRKLFTNMSTWPYVELGDEAGVTGIYGGKVEAGTLLEAFEQVCQECDIGFRVRFSPSGRKLFFELFRPDGDANSRYAPQYGNLSDLVYTESITDYKNVAIVIGATLVVGAGQTDLSGYERREMIVDASSEEQGESETDDEYKARLIALGEAELAAHTKTENFTFTPSDDVIVGQVVYASLPNAGIEAAARITSVTLTSQVGENSVSVEIGTPIIRRLS